VTLLQTFTKRYQAYQYAQCLFSQKSVFSVTLFKGELRVQNHSMLEDIVCFRFPLEQHFDSTTHYPDTGEYGALAHYRMLFDADFASAMKVLFY